jgi:hypothetical protein
MTDDFKAGLLEAIKMCNAQAEVYAQGEKDWRDRWSGREGDSAEYAWRRMETYARGKDVLHWIVAQISNECGLGLRDEGNPYLRNEKITPPLPEP